MIEPTVGRVVWFTPAKDDDRFKGYCAPLAAHVSYVWGSRCVNLMVIHPEGGCIYGETSVTLLQDDDANPEHGSYAAWMPYQKGQAAKHEKENNLAEARLMASAGKPLI